MNNRVQLPIFENNPRNFLLFQFVIVHFCIEIRGVASLLFLVEASFLEVASFACFCLFSQEEVVDQL